MNTSYRSAAKWLTRAVFVLMVLAGVLLMHSLVVQPAAGGGPDAGHAVMSSPMSEHGGAESPSQHCESGDCNDHSVLHLCVAMLAAVGTALVLTLLSRLAGGEGGVRFRTRMTSRVQGRAPPWAHFSLEKLSVLRL